MGLGEIILEESKKGGVEVSLRASQIFRGWVEWKESAMQTEEAQVQGRPGRHGLKKARKKVSQASCAQCFWKGLYVEDSNITILIWWIFFLQCWALIQGLLGKPSTTWAIPQAQYGQWKEE
jgi:hypothetical protein